MEEYFKNLIAESKPSLIVFMHAAEQNAVDVKYLVEELKAKYGNRVNVQRVDVSYNRKEADEYRINAFPTWILFKDGQELMRESGMKTVDELSELVERGF